LDRGCLRAQHGERFRTGLLIGQNRGAAGPAKESAHGSTLARPMLERLRDSVATGEVDRVYVHAPARSSRPANREHAVPTINLPTSGHAPGHLCTSFARRRSRRET